MSDLDYKALHEHDGLFLFVIRRGDRLFTEVGHVYGWDSSGRIELIFRKKVKEKYVGTILEERDTETKVNLKNLLWCKPVSDDICDCDRPYYQQQVAEMEQVAQQLAKGLKPTPKASGKSKKGKEKIGFFTQIFRLFKILGYGALALLIAVFAILLFILFAAFSAV